MEKVSLTHSTASTTSKRVSHLKALQAIASLGLLANNIQDGIDKFGT